MDLDDVLAALRTEIEAVGTAKAWAERQGVNPSYVSDVLNKNRDPGPVILNALGLEKVVSYRVAAE